MALHTLLVWVCSSACEQVANKKGLMRPEIHNIQTPPAVLYALMPQVSNGTGSAVLSL